MATHFAPENMASFDELRRQQDIMHDVPMLEILLNAVPISILVLNSNRQIIYGNLPFLQFIETLGSSDPLGRRPGDVLRCVNAQAPDACGTTEFCLACGAVRAIMKAQEGINSVEECRIQVMEELEIDALDLRVWATPFAQHGETFTIFAVVDISDEKRRGVLEKIFFHDVMNQAGAVLGFADLLALDEKHKNDERTELMLQAAERLVAEIQAQRDLTSAERGELTVAKAVVSTINVIADIAGTYATIPEAKGRILRVDPKTADTQVFTDATILARVLGNMVKNALEATRVDETVTIGVNQEENALCFWVHNPGFIPRKYQLELFKRSFSTKGKNRGLGTYSIKLLTEKYLGGKVSYSSVMEEGTRFEVRIPVTSE